MEHARLVSGRTASLLFQTQASVKAGGSVLPATQAGGAVAEIRSHGRDGWSHGAAQVEEHVAHLNTADLTGTLLCIVVLNYLNCIWTSAPGCGCHGYNKAPLSSPLSLPLPLYLIRQVLLEFEDVSFRDRRGKDGAVSSSRCKAARLSETNLWANLAAGDRSPSVHISPSGCQLPLPSSILPLLQPPLTPTYINTKYVRVQSHKHIK